MPDVTLQQMKTDLDAMLQDDPNIRNNMYYQAFLESVANAVGKMTKLNTRDKYGRLPYMSKEDRTELMRLHMEIGTKAESVLRNEADKTRRDLVKKVTALAAGNHRALMNYDPAKKQKRLSTLISEVRTMTLDTRGAALQTPVANMSNSRQPITFLDSRGKPVTGVFTPAKYMNVRRNIQATIDRIKGQVKSTTGRQILDSFFDKVIAYGAKERKVNISNLSEDQKLALLDPFVQDVGEGDKKEKLDRESMVYVMEEIFADELQGKSITSKIPKKLLWQLGQAVCDESININVNLGSGHIPDGARLDSRNSAMSAVADLVGVPNLLARSRPMKLIMPDGSEVEGTFMAEASGLDPKNLDERAEGIDAGSYRHRGKSPEQKATIGGAMKALADLQVVDYLCGNVDRNYANMLYQFIEGKPKIFCGVQAIDNDCSLGVTKPGEDETEKEMAALNDMKVISASMSRAVRELTPETLRFCLQGFELSEEELEAAAFRLDKLKNKLQSSKEYYDNPMNRDLADPYIKVVEDHEWSSIKPASLQATVPGDDGRRSPANIFATAASAISLIDEDYRNQKKAFRSLKSEIAIGAGNRAIPSEQPKEYAKAASMLQLLENRTTQGRSSPQYDAMLEAVRKYAAYQFEVSNRVAMAKNNQVDPDAPIDRIVSTTDLAKMRELAKTVQEKADAYLEHKGGGLHFGYTARRIEAARLAREMGRTGAANDRMEAETAENNTREALEEMHNRIGDRLENEKAVPNAHLNQPAQAAPLQAGNQG